MKRRYRVYVVELEPHGSRRYADRVHVYVGSSALSPKVRLQHHLQGAWASRHVRDHGIRLLSGLAPRRSFDTRLEAREAERRLRRDLARRGFVVWGGNR